MGSNEGRGGSGGGGNGAEHFSRVRYGSVRAQSQPEPAPAAAMRSEGQQVLDRRVEEFALRDLHADARAEYGQVRAKYGSLAHTDSDREAKSRKDARFVLNAFSRASLSVDNEERRAIEERVRSRLGEAESEVREQGFRKGYEDGFRSGMLQAQEQFRQEARHRAARFDAFLVACEEAKTRIFAENEQAIAELVLRLGREILLRELKLDREHVVRLAQDLVHRYGLRESIRMEISREDAENIGVIEERLLKSAGELKNIQIEASDRVGTGGVLIETDWSVIDASVETQLRGLMEALLMHPVPDAAIRSVAGSITGSGRGSGAGFDEGTGT